MSIQDCLNPSQWEAVSYCNGPSLVIAGAGSGKTRVLTYKIAYLIEQGLEPWSILALTFTNKAAREMNSRIATVVGDEAAHGLWSGTFHSIFARILRREAEFINYTSDYTIYDSADSRSLIKAIIKEQGLDDKQYKPQVIAARISEAKNGLILPDRYCNDAAIAKRDRADGIAATGKLYKLYCQRCRAANAMDFDDLLLNTYLLFANHPAVCQKYRDRFQYILVDEYQDTNVAQHRIIRQLTDPTSRICVVGDDAQSIYAFRGADIGNILGFQEQYPTARLIKLERNYRSTKTIVGAANSLIKHNRGQIPKKVYSENEDGAPITLLRNEDNRAEAAKVAGEVRRLVRSEGLSYDDIAVLYRTNAQSRSFEEAFSSIGVPYRVYGGMSFYQRKEIKDVLAYCRLIANPGDEEAFKRIVNYPARGIGATTVAKIQACATEHETSMWNVCYDPDGYGLALNKGTLTKIGAFLALIDGFRRLLTTMNGYDLTLRIVKETGIMADILADTTDEGVSRKENIEELLNTIKQNEDEVKQETGQALVPLTAFLAQVSLLTDADQREDDEPRVTLMTVHAAKGLEYDAVFVTGMENDLFPNANARYFPKDMEEERRLFYVAITRAKRFCYLTYAEMRYRYGNMDFTSPSLFISEIDSQYLDDDRSTRSSRNEDIFARLSNNFAKQGNSFAKQGSNFAKQGSTFARRESSSPKPVPTPSAASLITHNLKLTTQIAGLSIGDTVEHDRFGIGTVVSLEGAGSNAKAGVDFRTAGHKNLLLKFAKIRKL